MPLLPDSSNEIKLSQIVEEFSPDRKRPWSINEYHRTMNVPRPVPDIPLTNPIPQSGEISLSDFHGTSDVIRVNPTITINDRPYDGTTNLDEDSYTFTIPELVPGFDRVSVVVLNPETNITLESPDIGEQTVTAGPGGLILRGVDAGNYRFGSSTITGTVNITGQRFVLPYSVEDNRAGYQGTTGDFRYEGARIVSLTWQNRAEGTGVLILDNALELNNVIHNSTQTLIQKGTGFTFRGTTRYNLAAVNLVPANNFFEVFIS